MKWLLTDDGRLINADRMEHIYYQNDCIYTCPSGDYRYSLCTCKDDAHGKRIIVRIATLITGEYHSLLDCATIAREEA